MAVVRIAFPRNCKAVVGPRNASVGVLPAFRPEDMLTAYNANIDTTVQLLNAAFSTLSRFQHLQAERGEKVLLLAGDVPQGEALAFPNLH